MKRALPLAALFLIVACKSESGPAAPVVTGSFMTFEITDSTPSGPLVHDVKLTFTAKGELFQIRIETAGQADEVIPSTIMVDKKLVPESNVIGAYSFGRLWLPPEARAVGKRTPCGSVSRTQKYKDWEVFRVDGLCGTSQGSRFYESQTGMLVGFIFSGSVDRSSYVKASG